MSSIHNTMKAACALLGLGVSTPVWAQPARSDEVARPVAAVRRGTRTISNATAWMPRAGELHLALGLEQNFHPIGDVAFGLGGLAEFGVAIQRERSECSECGEDKEDRSLSTAYFKIGLPEGTGHAIVPGVALVFRKALPGSVQVFTDPEAIFSRQEEAMPTAFLTAVASKSFGPAALHLGAELLAAERGQTMTDALESPTIRPAVGLEYVPGAYPETTLLFDARWIPSLDADGTWGTVWNAAGGIRYQALDWASVDLNVRLQEAEGAGDALVTLGVRGIFDLTRKTR